jgi:hypothetical protein
MVCVCSFETAIGFTQQEHLRPRGGAASALAQIPHPPSPPRLHQRPAGHTGAVSRVPGATTLTVPNDMHTLTLRCAAVHAHLEKCILDILLLLRVCLRAIGIRVLAVAGATLQCLPSTTGASLRSSAKLHVVRSARFIRLTQAPPLAGHIPGPPARPALGAGTLGALSGDQLMLKLPRRRPCCCHPHRCHCH